MIKTFYVSDEELGVKDDGHCDDDQLFVEYELAVKKWCRERRLELIEFFVDGLVVIDVDTRMLIL